MGRRPLHDWDALAQAIAQTAGTKAFKVADLVESQGTKIKARYTQMKRRKDVEPELPSSSEQLRWCVWTALQRHSEMFENVAHGTYVLAAPAETSQTRSGLKDAIELHNQEVREQFFRLLEEMKTTLPKGPKLGDVLVSFTNELLVALRFNVTTSPKASHDGGVDVAATRVDEFGQTQHYVIQLKHWQRTSELPKAAATELTAHLSKDHRDHHRALLITTSAISKAAHKVVAEHSRASLIDGDQLFDLCVQFEVGVRVIEIPDLEDRLVFLDKQWFEKVRNGIDELRPL